jgi:hypothetical protein
MKNQRLREAWKKVWTAAMKPVVALAGVLVLACVVDTACRSYVASDEKLLVDELVLCRSGKNVAVEASGSYVLQRRKLPKPKRVMIEQDLDPIRYPFGAIRWAVRSHFPFNGNTYRPGLPRIYVAYKGVPVATE